VWTNARREYYREERQDSATLSNTRPEEGNGSDCRSSADNSYWCTVIKCLRVRSCTHILCAFIQGEWLHNVLLLQIVRNQRQIRLCRNTLMVSTILLVRYFTVVCISAQCRLWFICVSLIVLNCRLSRSLLACITVICISVMNYYDQLHIQSTSRICCMLEFGYSFIVYLSDWHMYYCKKV